MQLSHLRHPEKSFFFFPIFLLSFSSSSVAFSECIYFIFQHVKVSQEEIKFLYHLILALWWKKKNIFAFREGLKFSQARMFVWRRYWEENCRLSSVLLFIDFPFSLVSFVKYSLIMRIVEIEKKDRKFLLYGKYTQGNFNKKTMILWRYKERNDRAFTV